MPTLKAVTNMYIIGFKENHYKTIKILLKLIMCYNLKSNLHIILIIAVCYKLFIKTLHPLFNGITISQ